MKCLSSKATCIPQQKNLIGNRELGGLNRKCFGILKIKFQILHNLDMGLEYAPIVFTICCKLHNHLIEKRTLVREENLKRFFFK
jgi:hypothetical protein